MKTMLNVKTDLRVKKDAQRAAAESGFSLSALVNAYLKQFARNKEVYFTAAPRMNPELEKLLAEVETDIRQEKNLSPKFSTATEMDRYLDSL